MDKIWIIIQREYITRVKRKSFLITTLLAPLGFFLLLASSVLISTYSQGKTDVAIIDESGLFKDIDISDAENEEVYFHKVGDSFDKLSGELAGKKDGKYQAIIHIPSNFKIDNPHYTQIAGKFTERLGFTKREAINTAVTEMVHTLQMRILKIDEETRKRINEKVKVDFTSLNDEKESKGYTEAAAAVGLVMGFAIYISLFFYGTMIMKGVMEEKTSRIVEVLASSVKPFQLLMGKIVGVGAVGLTQFILWIILTGLVYLFALPLLGLTVDTSQAQMNQMNNSEVDPDFVYSFVHNLKQLPLFNILVLFPFYFLGGFLLYGSLFAAVGAAMGEDGDQQSLMVPITVPIIISIFIALNVINNPESGLGFWGSIIPFTSPVVMCALLPFRPEWWQIALSILSLTAGFIFTTWMAARVYRVGILSYGKKVKLKEIGKWIFSKG